MDETGDLKKGTATVGVQRQYTGTAGRTENAQVAVYLAYAAPAGSAFIDRALYLPRSWTSDPARCQAAGVPQDTAFATKPALAMEMIGRAIDAGAPAAWVAADEVYGQDPQLRAELARRGLGYVLAVAKSHPVVTGIGSRTAVELAQKLAARAWQRISAGPGAKGPRWYDWTLIEAADPAVTSGDGPHWLLIRRRISDGELAFYRAHAPGPVPLAQLVKVAGSRWKVEDGFAGGKELAALDEHQVRSWTSWHRWTILALLARAFLSVLAAAQPTGGDSHDDQLIPLTRNEICKAAHRAVPETGRPLHAAALVPMATPASGHRPSLPLPPTSHCTRMITKCRWSIRWPAGSPPCLQGPRRGGASRPRSGSGGRGAALWLSTVAVARVLGMIESDPEEWMLLVTAAERRSLTRPGNSFVIFWIKNLRKARL